MPDSHELRAPTTLASTPPRSLAVLAAWLRRALRDQRGAGYVEYLILVAFCGLSVAVYYQDFNWTLSDSVGDRVAALSVGGARPNATYGSERVRYHPELTGPTSCNGGNCQTGPGPNGCFAAGTPVFTADGDRPIESIRPGDLVWSRDEATGAMALKPVLSVKVTEDAPVLDVRVDGPQGSEYLIATLDHPFWVEQEGWQPAAALGAERALWSPEGARVGAAGAPWSEHAVVYNFEVADYHTYFVGELHSWVHNTCETTPPSNPSGNAINRCMQNARSYGIDTRGPGGRERGARLRQQCDEQLRGCYAQYPPAVCEKIAACVIAYQTANNDGRWNTTSDPVENERRMRELRNECATKTFNPDTGRFTTQPNDRPAPAYVPRYSGCNDSGSLAGVNSRRARQYAPEYWDQRCNPDPNKQPRHRPHDQTPTEELGMAAAQDYADRHYGGRDWVDICQPKGGHSFDIVRYNQRTGELVIIEAKAGQPGPDGRGPSADPRWNGDRSGSVQQGTRDYALTIAEAMKKSRPTVNEPPGCVPLYDEQLAAIEADDYRYLRVFQPVECSDFSNGVWTPRDYTVDDYAQPGTRNPNADTDDGEDEQPADDDSGEEPEERPDCSQFKAHECPASCRRARRRLGFGRRGRSRRLPRAPGASAVPFRTRPNQICRRARVRVRSPLQSWSPPSTSPRSSCGPSSKARRIS